MAEKIPQPKWILFVRAARALIAVIVLGLCAYTIQIVAMQQAQFNIFVAILTFLITVYVFVAEISFPQAYNKWIVLAIEIVALVFWLGAFASLAALAANADACFDMAERYLTICYAYNSLDKRSLEKRRGVWDRETAREWYSALAAASGLGAICFVLSIIILTVFCMALQRHRQSNAQPAVGAAPVPAQNIPPASHPDEKMHPMSPMSPVQGAQPYAQPQQVHTPSSSPSLPPGYTHPAPPPMTYQNSGTSQQYPDAPPNLSELSGTTGNQHNQR